MSALADSDAFVEGPGGDFTESLCNERVGSGVMIPEVAPAMVTAGLAEEADYVDHAWMPDCMVDHTDESSTHYTEAYYDSSMGVMRRIGHAFYIKVGDRYETGGRDWAVWQNPYTTPPTPTLTGSGQWLPDKPYPGVGMRHDGLTLTDIASAAPIPTWDEYRPLGPGGVELNGPLLWPDFHDGRSEITSLAIPAEDPEGGAAPGDVINYTPWSLEPERRTQIQVWRQLWGGTPRRTCYLTPGANAPNNPWSAPGTVLRADGYARNFPGGSYRAAFRVRAVMELQAYVYQASNGQLHPVTSSDPAIWGQRHTANQVITSQVPIPAMAGRVRVVLGLLRGSSVEQLLTIFLNHSPDARTEDGVTAVDYEFECDPGPLWSGNFVLSMAVPYSTPGSYLNGVWRRDFDGLQNYFGPRHYTLKPNLAGLGSGVSGLPESVVRGQHCRVDLVALRPL